MKSELQDTIRTKLEDRSEQAKFLNGARDFLQYVEADCMGLSPGLSAFQQASYGLRHMASTAPDHRKTFDDAADIYDTLVAKAPGAMYPRGSEMFDLTKVGAVEKALDEALDTDWEDVRYD